MYIPEIKESGNFQVSKIVYYPKRRDVILDKKINFLGYFELFLECLENENTKRIEITIFDNEFDRMARVKYNFD